MAAARRMLGHPEEPSAGEPALRLLGESAVGDQATVGDQAAAGDHGAVVGEPALRLLGESAVGDQAAAGDRGAAAGGMLGKSIPFLNIPKRGNEQEKMIKWVRDTYDKLWDNRDYWQTGPILVALDVPKEMFRFLSEYSVTRKTNLMYIEAESSLWILGDGTFLHEGARDWLAMVIRESMIDMGFRLGGKEPNAIVTRGGRVEFAAGFEQQVDFAVYEFQPGLSFDYALTPLVIEVVYINERKDYLRSKLERMCEADLGSTKMAIGVFFPLDILDAPGFQFQVMVKKRGEEVVEYSFVDGETEALKIEIEVHHLFTFPEAKNVVPPGRMLVIDFREMRDWLIWTKREPMAQPGYRKKSRRN